MQIRQKRLRVAVVLTETRRWEQGNDRRQEQEEVRRLDTMQEHLKAVIKHRRREEKKEEKKEDKKEDKKEEIKKDEQNKDEKKEEPKKTTNRRYRK